jgi:hypothetical protein
VRATQQAPKLPPDMPVLMLGGARDEVVPRSQMQDLWATLCSRGRDAEGSTSARTSGASRTASEKARAEVEAKGNDEPGPDDPKAPPRVYKDGTNKYIEFGAGMHSMFSLSLSLFGFPFVRAEFRPALSR